MRLRDAAPTRRGSSGAGAPEARETRPSRPTLPAAPEVDELPRVFDLRLLALLLHSKDKLDMVCGSTYFAAWEPFPPSCCACWLLRFPLLIRLIRLFVDEPI